MEEKDIKIIEEIYKDDMLIEELLQAYKQDEKIINEMAKYFEGYEINDLITLNSQKEAINYFRKKCE